MHILLAVVLAASPAGAQPTPRPLAPIDTVTGAIVVNVAEFATVPDIQGVAARMMLLVDEPGTRRLFVNDMRGPIYSVSYDGRTVRQYIDVNDSTWGVHVQSTGRERGMQSFAFHPQFAQSGAPGYGKFYTWTDVRTNDREPDFRAGGGTNTHHTVLHEWTARTAGASTYDGGVPREIMRLEQPFANHNGGMAAFNPLAKAGSEDFGLLYLGVADGGSGGDPLNVSQNLTSIFGKILRIDPLGRSVNNKYAVPRSNPFAGGRRADARAEIYASGVRNPQRFAWDPSNGTMYMADIGQNTVEKVSKVTPGANLGWNVWEGSYRYAGRAGVNTTDPRGDRNVLYPVVEYQHDDPLFQRQVAVTGVNVIRGGNIAALRNKVLFGDNPSGELFSFDADNVPNGGVQGIRLVRLGTASAPRTNLLSLIKAKNGQQNKPAATRADLRLGHGADGRTFLLNKADGTIRVLVP